MHTAPVQATTSPASVQLKTVTTGHYPTDDLNRQVQHPVLVVASDGGALQPILSTADAAAAPHSKAKAVHNTVQLELSR